MTSGIITLLYWVIAGVCVGLSFATTYGGLHGELQSDFRWLALPLASVFALGLFACDLAILDRRKAGQPIVGVVLVLLLLTTITFAANYTFFYTGWMRGEVAATEFKSAYDKFDANMRLAEDAVGKETELPKLRERTGRRLQNYRDEVTDLRKPGRGSEAIAIENELYPDLARHEIKPQPPQRLAPNASAKERKDFVDDVERRVWDAFNDRERRDPAMRALMLIDDKRKAAKKLYDVLEPTQGKAADSRLSDERLAASRKWEEETKEVVREVNQLYRLGKSARKLDLELTSSRGKELGRIWYALSSGFTEPQNLGGAILSSALSILIDITPLLIALFVRPVKDAPRPRPPPRPSTRWSFGLPKGVPRPRSMRDL